MLLSRRIRSGFWAERLRRRTCGYVKEPGKTSLTAVWEQPWSLPPAWEDIWKWLTWETADFMLSMNGSDRLHRITPWWRRWYAWEESTGLPRETTRTRISSPERLVHGIVLRRIFLIWNCGPETWFCFVLMA